MSGSRIGVMGGTFDPIHHGHLVAASEVAGLFGLDEVIFVPTGQPWQKSDRQVSPGEDRYLMTVIATASNPRFSVSRVDIDRGGPTYTVDTLTDLKRQRPDAELFFITGADALSQILSWRDSEKCFALAHFIGVTRPGFVLEDAHLPEGAVSLVEVPALAISSSDCRDRVARGMPVWYLVPDGVVQYIDKRALYRGSRAGRRSGSPLAATAAQAGESEVGARRPVGDRPTYDRNPGSHAAAGSVDQPPTGVTPATGAAPRTSSPPEPGPPTSRLQELPR